MTTTQRWLAAALLGFAAGCGGAANPGCFDTGVVCGADGKTYENACDANAAGVSFRSGACFNGSGGDSGGGPFGGSGGSPTTGGTGGITGGTGGVTGGTGGVTGGTGGVTGGTGGATGGIGGTAGSWETGGTGGTGGSTGGSSADGGVAVLCGGIAGLKCGAGEACMYPDGQCRSPDAAGTCQPVGNAACPANYLPVCGCNGTTYGNACEARVRGVSVLYQGACVDGGVDGGVDAGSRRCGGIAGLTCDKGEACIFPEGLCRIPDAMGTCRKTGAVPCPMQVNGAVCGCDGQTYGSECAANASGVSVQYQGACSDGGPRTCGGSAGVACNKGESCVFPVGTCKTAGASGTCQSLITNVSCTADVRPVCGCDGKTYSNACAATIAGVSVLHEGACSTSCAVGSAVYPDGTAGIPAPDGCNTCSCSAGQLLCTLRACSATSCIIDSKVYADGTVGVPDPFTCNNCTCAGGALTECTHYPCKVTPPPCQVGRAFYRDGSESITADGSVKCVCQSGSFNCAPIQ
jgi:hypothetical protein